MDQLRTLACLAKVEPGNVPKMAKWSSQPNQLHPHEGTWCHGLPTPSVDLRAPCDNFRYDWPAALVR